MVKGGKNTDQYDGRVKVNLYPGNRLSNGRVLADHDVVDILTECWGVVVDVHEVDCYHSGATEGRVPAIPGFYGEVVILTYLEVQIIGHKNRS